MSCLIRPTLGLCQTTNGLRIDYRNRYFSALKWYLAVSRVSPESQIGAFYHKKLKFDWLSTTPAPDWARMARSNHRIFIPF